MNKSHLRTASQVQYAAPSPVHEQPISQEVVAYVHRHPAIFAIIIDLIPIIGEILKWKPSARTALTKIVSSIGGERHHVDVRHRELGGGFWPDLHTDSAKRKITRYVKQLKEDQEDSNFKAVYMIKGHIVEGDDDEYISTRYQLGKIVDVANIIADQIDEKGLDFTKYKKRIVQYRAMIQAALDQVGAVPIDRVAKEKLEKEQKEPKPKCDCPKCGARHTKKAIPKQMSPDEQMSYALDLFDRALGEATVVCDTQKKAYELAKSAHKIVEQWERRQFDQLQNYEMARLEAKR